MIVAKPGGRFGTQTRPLPASVYAETAAPAPDMPPLDGSRHVSVAIVGGGFTGLSAALHLAEAGVEAVVLEASTAGWGASGRNGGQVNPGLIHDPDTVERDFGADLGGRMIARSYGAPEMVFGLIARHGIACEARQGGTHRVAFDRRSAAGIAALVSQYRRRAMPVEHLGPEALAARTGTGRYRAGLVDPRGGSVNPLGYARGLARAALKAGAAVHGETPVNAVRRDGGLWRVETGRGTVTAERLVLATNAYSDDLWPKLRRTVVPVYSAIAASEPLPAGLVARILPSGGGLYEMGHDTVYYRVDSAGRLLMGGRGPQRDTSDPADYRHLIAYAERLWPALAGVRWTHFWNGQLAITLDHYPHFHEPAEGVLAALGYNGRGIAMATVAGNLLARRLLGDPPEAIDLPITRALKPIPFHGLWRPAVEARMLYGRLRDFLGL